MSNIVKLPGVSDASLIPAGSPRPDISQMLRDLADRADAGEFRALALAISMSDDNMLTAVSTPENAFYSMLGALTELQWQIRERQSNEKMGSEYD